MKLKCDAHHRRILATETSFLHKTGDNSTCNSKTATIGSQTFAVGHVASLPMSNQVKNHPHFETLEVPEIGTKEFDTMIIENGHTNFKELSKDFVEDEAGPYTNC